MKLKLKKIQQPTHETCCQTCLAILTKKTIRDIVDITDLSGGMYKSQILKVLRKFKIKYKVKNSRGVVPKVKQAFMQILKRGEISHLVIKKGNKIFDPWYGKSFKIVEYNKKYMRGYVYNWYIEIL